MPTLTALKSHSDPVSHNKVPLLRLPSLRSENVEKEPQFSPTLLSPASQDVSQVNAAAPGKEVIEPPVKVIEPRVKEFENKVVRDPSLFAEDKLVKENGDPEDRSKASADAGR